MKRFLYYNQDSVNSLLAQIGQGLLLKAESGKEETSTSSAANSIGADLTGDLGAKVFGIGATLKGELTGTSSDEEVTSKMIRNVQEKALHDYAFEKVFEHISQQNLIKNKNPEIGDFVSIEEAPTFLDFDYFMKVFADNGAVWFVNEQGRKKIKSLKDSIHPGTKLPQEIKIQIKELDDQFSSAETERKDTETTLEVIRNTLPYNHFLLTSSLLVPLDDSNFRDDPSIVAFKYGGKMTIFGYVTNIITKIGQEEASNSFAPMYTAINQIMLNLIDGANRLYIIHPIALFY